MRGLILLAVLPSVALAQDRAEVDPEPDVKSASQVQLERRLAAMAALGAESLLEILTANSLGLMVDPRDPHLLATKHLVSLALAFDENRRTVESGVVDRRWPSAKRPREEAGARATRLITRMLTYRGSGDLEGMSTLIEPLEGLDAGNTDIALLLGLYLGSDTPDHDPEEAIDYLRAVVEATSTEIDLPVDLVRSLVRDDLWDYTGVADPAAALKLRASFVEDLKRLNAGERLDWATTPAALADEEFDQVLIHRNRREPEEMLKLLGPLADREPENLGILFALGEAHSSVRGPTHRQAAIRAFDGFLALTDSSGPESGNLALLRDKVTEYREELRNRRALYILTPLPVVEAQLARVTGESERMATALANVRSQIAEQQSLMETYRQETWRKSRNFNVARAAQRIRELESRERAVLEGIERINKRIANLTNIY